MPAKSGRTRQTGTIFKPEKEVMSGQRGQGRLHAEVCGDGTCSQHHSGGACRWQKGWRGKSARLPGEHQEASADWTGRARGTGQMRRGVWLDHGEYPCQRKDILVPGGTKNSW